MGLAPLVWTFDDEEAKSKAARQATLYRSESNGGAASHALQEPERQQRGKPRYKGRIKSAGRGKWHSIAMPLDDDRQHGCLCPLAAFYALGNGAGIAFHH